MVVLGLGSNIGDRLEYLRAATQRLASLMTDMRFSAIVESPAMLPAGATAEHDHPYLNMAVAGTTDITPRELLVAIKAIEREVGRVPRGFWGSREIDIDILAMGTLTLQEEDLIIPHYGLLKRSFALIPLMQVAPNWRYPVPGEYYNQTAEQIVATLGYRLGNDLSDPGISLHG